MAVDLKEIELEEVVGFAEGYYKAKVLKYDQEGKNIKLFYSIDGEVAEQTYSNKEVILTHVKFASAQLGQRLSLKKMVGKELYVKVTYNVGAKGGEFPNIIPCRQDPTENDEEETEENPE